VKEITRRAWLNIPAIIHWSLRRPFLLATLTEVRGMEFRGTPGPWVRESAGRGIGPVSEDDDQSYGMVIPVAYVDFGESDDIQNANARLIASAPELLEALIEMTSIVKQHSYPQPDKPNSNWARAECAESIISKALGEE